MFCVRLVNTSDIMGSAEHVDINDNSKYGAEFKKFGEPRNMVPEEPF